MLVLLCLAACMAVSGLSLCAAESAVPAEAEEADAALEAASAEADSWPVITANVDAINKYGNVHLTISGNTLKDQGYEFLDIVTVRVAGQEMDVPIVASYSDVETGEALLILYTDSDTGESKASLALNMSDFASSLGIAEKVNTEEGSGYTWEYLLPTPVEVTISMKEKNGYAELYEQVRLVRTNERADYADLTDEEYANFRNVATTGMGRMALYRTSSPVNPGLNRNREADEALNNAGVRTVVNLADSEDVMKGYEGYANSYYSQRDVIALNMDLNFEKEIFRAKLAKGLTFLAEHEGPYLVHCTEGKDRCGFVSALLECLMGATADEVLADYMVTYYNYYGVEPGTAQYQGILDRNIIKTLQTVFGVEDIRQADLAAEAEEYLKESGLDGETIEKIRTNLGRSWAE